MIKIILSAADPSMRMSRFLAAKSAGIIPEPGAIERLAELIKHQPENN